MTIWNKLVRDRIPEIIEASGSKAVTRKLLPSEVTTALKAKLLEEAAELAEATTAEAVAAEAADVLEVLQALCDEYAVQITHVTEVQLRKRNERGGFTERVFLLETTN